MAGNQEDAVTSAHKALKAAKSALNKNLSVSDRRRAEEAIRKAHQKFNGAYNAYAENMQSTKNAPKSQDWWH